MELFLLLLKVEGYAALYAVPAEYRPLVQYLVNAHYAGSTVYQHVEVAVEVILKRSQPEQLVHNRVGVLTLLEVERQPQTGKVADIGNFLQLAFLNEVDYLVDYSLDGGRGRYLSNLDTARVRVVAVHGAYLHRAKSGAVYLVHLRLVVDDVAAAREIRTFQRGKGVVLRILHEGYSGFANLAEIERADVARH